MDRSIHVLHVDDEPGLGELAATFLEREDDSIDVRTATHPDDGLEILADHEVDCVVSDYDMPRTNGIEFLEAVREEYPDLPFILFTGKGSEEVASRAISAGVTDYLQKESGTDQYAILANRIRNVVERRRAERERERMRERMELALEHTDSVIFEFDLEKEEVFRHGTYEQFFEFPATDAPTWKDHLERAVHPDDREEFRRFYQRLIDGDSEGGTLEYRTHPDRGGVRWIRDTVSVQTESADGARQAVGIARDITEYRERERKLRRQERRYRAVFDDPNILVGLVDTDGTVLDINRVAMEYTGAGFDEVRDEPLWETPWFDRLEAVRAEAKEWVHCAASGEYVEFETELGRPDGSPYTFEGVVRPVTDDDGEVVSLLISGRDVTDRREQKRRTDRIVDRVTDAIVEVDSEWRFTHVNEQAEELYDMAEESLLGRDFWDVFTEARGTRFEEEYRRVMETREPTSFVEYFSQLDGWFDIEAYPKDDGGIAFYFIEVTAQREHQRELERTNEVLSTLVETLPVAVLAEDESRNVLAVNGRMFELFELPGTPDELVGEDCELIAEDVSEAFVDPDGFVERTDDLIDEGEPVHGEELRLRGDRTYVRSYEPITLPEGDGHLWVYRDVTDRKAREIRLRETSARLEALFENSPDMIDVLDPEGTLLDVNRRFCEELGYDEDDLLGRPVWEIDRTVDADDVEELLSNVSPGERRRFEGRYERRDGSTLPVEVHLLRADIDGETRFLAISRGIAERKEEERQIRTLHDTAQEIQRAETDDRVARVVVEAVDDILDMPINAVYLHESDENALRPVAWTDRGTEVFGDPPTFRPGTGLAWEVFEAGETAHYDDVSAVPGRYNPDTPIRSEIIAPLGEHGVAIVGSTDVGAFDGVDVSLVETLAAHAETALDRISRARALEASEARYRSLTDDVLDTSSVGTFILDSNFEVVWITEATEEYFDLDRSAVLGANKRRLIDDHIKHIFEGSESFADTVLATYDDNTYVEEFECHVLPGDDRAERWLNHWSQPIESGLYEGGRIEHYTDVTDRKRREQELRTKNARLEEFSRVVSHDLRNPLNVAGGHLELAREECDSTHLDSVRDAIDRCRALLDDVFTLAREGDDVDEPEPVALGALTRSSWESVATAEATLVTGVDRTIRADPSRLQQLLENLVRNAIEHGGEDVTVTVGALPDGFYVEDDGPGIPAENREDVFEAGYSTNQGGTGFGLSIVERIVEAHDWEIRVTEGVDGGARFEITGVEFTAE